MNRSPQPPLLPQIHSISRARTDQPSPANMHFANRCRHLLDRAEFLRSQTMRQKSLIDQLHDAFIRSFKPDRSKVLAAYFHTLSRFCVVLFTFDIET